MNFTDEQQKASNDFLDLIEPEFLLCMRNIKRYAALNLPLPAQDSAGRPITHASNGVMIHIRNYWVDRYTSLKRCVSREIIDGLKTADEFQTLPEYVKRLLPS